MSSNQSTPNVDDANGLASTESSATAIPDFVRAWELAPQVTSSVRRPSTLPDPNTYHEAIEPDAIFELDERQKDESMQTILVVPAGCKRCRYTLKQACSRARPTCVRCRNAGLKECEVIDRGYQRLPRPKIGKCSPTQKQNASKAREEPVASTLSAPQPSTSGRTRHSRLRQLASAGVTSLSQSPPLGSRPKRSLTPDSDFDPPRKRGRKPKTAPRKGKARGRVKHLPPQEPDADCLGISATSPSAPVEESTGKRSTLRWTFVGRDAKPTREAGREPSQTPTPRVWTNSLGGLLTVFPELSKSKVGFSWFQSETPVLLLDTNYAQRYWISPTTLNIDLLWDFSCHESELELMDTENPGQLRVYQSGGYSSENAPDPETDTTGLRALRLPSGNGLLSNSATISSPWPPLSTPAPPTYDIRQDTQNTCQRSRSSCTEERGQHPESSGAGNNLRLGPLVQSVDNSSQSHPALNESPNHPPERSSRPCIPLKKPPEVDTLLDSHARLIPLLIWTAQDSQLLPCKLSPEYAYLCLGFFFISNLRHTVVSSGLSTTERVQGRVCWSVTLQWAPGGEDPLYDYPSVPSPDEPSGSMLTNATRDLSRPWWIDSADTSSQVDFSHHPRDLRMQFFSFIPLDLLAEFHPNESFPRGWFCKSCGMINVQVFFRHQICQSTTCKSTSDKCSLPGKVESLLTLRNPYQTSILVRPTNYVPLGVVLDTTAWDDDMQSWVYNVKDGVTLCHVFTGNQEHLQEDATALLESVQREVVLRKEDPSSPFFTQSTSLTHPSDGSDTMVPNGTPDCVRTAYHTLCDLVRRYGEMDEPRFGEVRLLAWAISGSRKGNLLHAARSPGVIYCLGADVGLKFIPKRGYRDASKSDKNGGCAEEHDRVGSPLSAGPSCLPEHDNGNQTPFISESEAQKTPTVIRNTDLEAAMDTVECCGSGPHSSTGKNVVYREVTEQPVRKKNKTVKGKNRTNDPEICVTLVHGDCVILYGDDFEYQIVRTGTTILVIGVPEKTR